MWYYIGSNSRKLSGHIQRLASYLHSCGADLRASTPLMRTSRVTGHNQTFKFGVSSYPDFSVVDLTYLALLNSFHTKGEAFNPHDCTPIPYSLISEIGTDIDRSFLSRVEDESVELSTKSGLLSFVTSTPSDAGIIAGE